MNQRLYLARVYNKEIGIMTNYEIDKSFSESAELYLPDVKFSQSKELYVSPTHIIYSCFSTQNKKFENKRNLIHLEDYDKKLLINDTLMVASRLSDELLIKDKVYPIHSSCVAKNESAVLLIGSSSTGKTTTALKTCIDDNEISFYSGDKTLLEDNFVVGGTKRVHVRKGSVLFELPYLKSYFEVEDNDKVWDEYIHLRASSIGLQEDSEKKYIEAIVIPKKVSSGLKIKKLNKDESFLRIHENMTHFLYYPHVLKGQKAPITQFLLDNDDRLYITEYADNISSLPTYNVSGSLEEISKFVRQLL